MSISNITGNTNAYAASTAQAVSGGSKLSGTEADTSLLLRLTRIQLICIVIV